MENDLLIKSEPVMLFVFLCVALKQGRTLTSNTISVTLVVGALTIVLAESDVFFS